MAKENVKTIQSVFYRNRFVYLAGICAAGIMTLVFFCYDLVPFGDMTILRMDLYHQYGPLFAELYDRVTEGGSLLYSWQSGLGGNFLGNFLNYLSSPFTLLIFVFGHENITEAISVMILLKSIASACSFAYYLKAATGRNDASIAAFGVLYAFCGYFVAYYWNVMWIDAMYLFPLVMLGIENIIRRGKPGLYCVSLALCFITNYYMAYMVCIFAVLYFLTFYFSKYAITEKFHSLGEGEPKPSIIRRLKNSVFFCAGWQFAFYSVLAVSLCCVLLFPLIEVLSSSSATSGSAPESLQKYFSAFDFLANHLAATEPTIRSSGTDVLPNVYCGILTLILVPLYLFCKTIPAREKAAHICLLGILYLSFDLNVLNFFWHGLHFPNDLPYRFSFMYSFILLRMAYRAFTQLKAFSMRQVLASGVALVVFIIFVEELTSKNVDDISLLLSLVFAVGYVVILHIFKNKKYTASAVSVLLLCTVLSEIALADTNKYSMNQSKTNYTSDYQDFRELKAQLDEYDSGFYRMELTNLRTRMDPSWYNYNGVSVFSSMAYEKTANLQSDVGLFSNYINSYTYNLQTPVYNAMFGLKYIVDNDNSNMSTQFYRRLFSTDGFVAYENLYDLPVAFTCNSAVASWDAGATTDPFMAQENWFAAATGIPSVFERLHVDYISYNNIAEFLEGEVESGSVSFQKLDANAGASFTMEFTPQTTGNVYVYIQSDEAETVTFSSNLFSKSVTPSDGYILDLGAHNAGETVYVDVSVKSTSQNGTMEFYAYTMDMTAFETGYESLADGGLTIDAYSDTYLHGTLTAGEDEIVYTSIPYDENWQIYVDGQPIYSEDIFAISEGLLGFRIGAGEHEITLRYVSAGLYTGAIVTCIAILFGTFLVICRRREWLWYKPKYTKKWTTLTSEETLPIPAAKTKPQDNFIAEYLDLDIIVEDRKKDSDSK